MVELRNHAHDLRMFFDRIGVEIVFLKQIAKFAQREAAGHSLDLARHVIGNNLFDQEQEMAGIAAYLLQQLRETTLDGSAVTRSIERVRRRKALLA